MRKLAVTVRYRDDVRHLHPTVLLSDSWPCKKAQIYSSLDSRWQILILNDSSCWYSGRYHVLFSREARTWL